MKKYILICILIFANTKPALAKFPNIIEHTEGDVHDTFAGWPILVIAGGAMTAAVARAVDLSVQGRFQTRHLGKADDIAKIIGEPYVLDPAALILFGAGELSHNEKISVTGETLFEALLFTDGVTGALKLGFNRKRPNGGNYSFPSGHAASTFAVATSLETLFGPKAGIPAYVAAGLIGYTRLDMNEHYISDLVFGAALGSAIGWGTAHFHKSKNPNLFVTPTLGESKGLGIVYNFK